MGMITPASDRVLGFAPASIIKRPLAILICGILLMAALPIVLAQTTNSDDDQAKISRLLREIQLRSSSWVERDSNGNVVTLVLYQHLADNERIETASKIHSLHELQLGFPTRVTKEGISHLIGMTNLSSVSLSCCPEFNPGVFEGICKIRGLRELSLVAARPPAKEYSAITNLQLLTVLQLGVGTNFGDHELSLLTNLPNLKSLEIGISGITSEGMKVLRQMKGLTNVKVLPKK